MAGSGVDRRRDAAAEETDEAFLDRVDLLVMAEWGRLQREAHLRELHATYRVRTEFLALLDDLFTIRRSAGSMAPLPSREELRLMLGAVRAELQAPAEPEPVSPGWELPEEDELEEWSLDSLGNTGPDPDRSGLVSKLPASESA